MSNSRDVAGFRSPRVAPAPGVVAVCEDCDHIWEPSFVELGTGPLTCTHCEGWTSIAPLASPDHG